MFSKGLQPKGLKVYPKGICEFPPEQTDPDVWGCCALAWGEGVVSSVRWSCGSRVSAKDQRGKSTGNIDSVYSMLRLVGAVGKSHSI